MKRIRTILLPTDFSETADNAVRFAMDLAGDEPVQFVLYHAFMPYESVFAGSSDAARRENREEQKQIQADMDKKLERYLQTHPGRNIVTVIDRGVETRQMIAYAKKHKVDLIVMGTIGASGLKEKLLGSVTAEIISRGPCPVMAVPNGSSYKGVSKVLMPTSFRLPDIEAAKFLVDFSVTGNSAIHFMHVGRGRRPSAAEKNTMETFQQAVKALMPQSVQSFSWHSGENPEELIVAVSAKEKPDLLVMTTYRKRGFFARFFHSSMTRKVAHHTHIPLLAYPVGSPDA